MSFLRRENRAVAFAKALVEQNNQQSQKPVVRGGTTITGNIITHILKHHVRRGELYTSNGHSVSRHAGGMAFAKALRAKGVVNV